MAGSMTLAQKGAVSLLDARGFKVVGFDAGVRRGVSIGVSQGGVAVWTQRFWEASITASRVWP